MISNKFVPVLCCAVVLALCGCSRQQSDWQKARETNTAEAYEQFLKKYPSGEFTAQAQARVKELYEERDWQKARDADTPEAYQAFLKQYPEGKWTEEARIRLENFTLAQTPRRRLAAAQAPAPGTAPGGATAETTPPAAAPAKPAQPSAQPARAGLDTPSRAGASKSHRAPTACSSGHSNRAADAANERWTRLQKEYPKLLGGLSSKVVPKKIGDGNALSSAGLRSDGGARARICKSLKSKSQPCVVVRPAHA